MKPWMKLAVVAILLPLAAGQLHYQWRKYHPARAAAAQGPLPPRADQVALPKGMVWPDGSLNFQADLHASKQSPAKIWELLQATPPAVGAPRDSGKAPILVFPFRDVTSDGVGVVLTQGWHPVGTGALALWTNAVLLSPDELWTCSAPAWNALATAPNDSAGWASYIRDQKAVPSDAVVISGLFRDGDTTATPVVELFWLKPGEAVPQPAFTDPAGDATTTGGLLEAQRREARMLADFVTKAGLATGNKGFGDPPAAELDAELRRIVIAANSRHSWLIQEAVNRALALARRYPGQHAPLQAAAYAQTALRAQTFTPWSYGRREDYLCALRAIATAQLAQQIDAAPLGPEILTWYNLLELDFKGTRREPEPTLGGWAILAKIKIDETRTGPEQAKVLPEWLALRLFRENIRFFGDGLLSGLRDEVAADRDNADLIGRVIQDAINAAERDGAFSIWSRNSQRGFEEDVQNFVALNLCLLADEDSSRTTRLAENLAKLASTRAIPTEGIGPADFLRVRAELGAARKGWAMLAGMQRGRWGAWDQPGSVYHNLLAVCSELRAHPPAALAAPTASGFAGLDYSNARRWVEYSTRLDWGLTRYLGFIRSAFGSEEMWDSISASVDSYFPDAGSPFWRQKGEYTEYTAQSGRDVDKALSTVRAVAKECPWDWPTLIFLARLEAREGDSDEAFAMVREAQRMGRHSNNVFAWTGGFYESIGCRRLAIASYGRHLQVVPNAYDIMGRWWALRVKLGDRTPHLRDLQAAANQLPANNVLVGNLLHYQTYVLKDYKGARRNYELFSPHYSAGANWPLDIALAAGDTSDTVKLVETMQAPPRNYATTLGMAKYHADKSAAYRKIGLLKEAEKELRLAEQQDPAMGPVMNERIKLAAARKEWLAVKTRATAMENRYGKDAETRTQIAKALWELNRRDEAIDLLVKHLKERPRDLDAVPPLLGYLAAQDRKAEAVGLMEWFLEAPSLWEDVFDQAVEAFVQVDPARAAAIKRDRLKYLGGPVGIPEATAWVARHRNAPLPPLLR